MMFIKHCKCPICKMMKASPCNDIFLPFKQCVLDHGGKSMDDKDSVDPCMIKFMDVQECMAKNIDYFQNVFQEGNTEEDTQTTNKE